MKNWIGNILLLLFSFSIVFLIGEVISRYASPISPGPSILDMGGNKQKISFVAAGKQFRIVTPDYDATTTITMDGYRAPEVSPKTSPDTLFIGDSFTYGQGVKDQEAFPAIYCKEKGIECANLAVPGASTLYELDRLEHYLENKSWSPNYVNLFIFTGNDFSDNLNAHEKKSNGASYEPVELYLNPQEEQQKGVRQRVVETGLHYSNLLRVAYFKVLPMLRDNPDETQKSLHKSLEITKGELERLHTLSKSYAFNYRVFVIFPQQEIQQGIYKELKKKIQDISPSPIIPLGELFAENTSDYFFPTDGHLNVEGNKKLAEFLLQNNL